MLASAEVKQFVFKDLTAKGIRLNISTAVLLVILVGWSLSYETVQLTTDISSAVGSDGFSILVYNVMKFSFGSMFPSSVPYMMFMMSKEERKL